ncbi:MAG: hypothetical protein P1Q69_20695 [Candidatus Thorarchaeota archaeon]|nr:hypothetical protein [Candidatus Thorarchaeota archaeon]
MRKKTKLLTLLSVFFVLFIVSGTTPMSLFYIVEGGGTSPPAPTWPQAATEYAYIWSASSGSWDDDTYMASATYETENHKIALAVICSSKNQAYEYAMYEISSVYTYKGERMDGSSWDTRGTILGATIEVSEYNYKDNQEATWQTADTAARCWPKDFRYNNVMKWSTGAKVAVKAGITLGVYLSPLTGGASAVAGLALGVATTILMDAWADAMSNTPDNSRLTGTDTYGRVYWENRYPTWAYHDYDDPQIGEDGYQYAYDFVSYNQLRHGWQGADGSMIALKFRLNVYLDDIGEPDGILTLSTPWTKFYTRA